MDQLMNKSAILCRHPKHIYNIMQMEQRKKYHLDQRKLPAKVVVYADGARIVQSVL